MTPELEKRMDALHDEMWADEDVEGENNPPQPQYAEIIGDTYNDAKRAQILANKHTIPKGSRPKVNSHAEAVLKSLAVAYDKAVSDSERLRASGDIKRAEIIEQQYLEDSFLPAVEAVKQFNSVDELLNNNEVLSAFDKYAKLRGNGSGYTASFLRTLYGDERGTFSGTSDAVVREAIRDIMNSIANDNVRGAVSTATSIKRKIDNGKNIASEDDYEFINRVIYRTK